MLTVTSTTTGTVRDEVLDEAIGAECEEAKFREEVKEKLREKKVVIVTARIHPGETCGSYVMEGFIKFITSEDPVAIELRERLIIKIVPMMNVDGVVLGNYRCCLSGHDLNRNFASPDAKLHPAICAVKKMVSDLQAQNKEILGYIDLHGHSRKKCSFIYGPHYPLHVDRYVRVRMLSKLLSDLTPMFRYAACKFRQQPSKVNTARLVLSREFDVMNCLTLENSFYGFIDGERKTIEYCSVLYEGVGQCLCYGLSEYLRLMDEERVLKSKRLYENRRKKKNCTRYKAKVKSKDSLNQDRQLQEFSKKDKKVENEYLSTKTKAREEFQDELIGKKVIRLEDIYEDPEMFINKRTKAPKIKDLINSIREDIKKEELEGTESDSSSSSSGEETLTKEEEATLVKTMLLSMKEPMQEAGGSVERIAHCSPQRERLPRRVCTAGYPERAKQLLRVNRLKEVEFPSHLPEPSFKLNVECSLKKPYRIADSK